MKVEIKSVVAKPVYEPVVITLETAEEYFSLMAALGISSNKRELERLAAFGIGYIEGTYVSYAKKLHGDLIYMFDKVKETI
jgi:hypothetical protein